MTTKALRTENPSWYTLAINDQPIVDGEGRPLPSQIQMANGEVFTPIGFDHGNDAVKATVLDACQPRLVTIRVPTTYRPAQPVSTGDRVLTFETAGHERFWIGADAIDQGESLPIGSTDRRLVDGRHRAFLAACVIEALVAARYAPGTYYLAVGFGVPDEDCPRRRR